MLLLNPKTNLCNKIIVCQFVFPCYMVARLRIQTKTTRVIALTKEDLAF